MIYKLFFRDTPCWKLNNTHTTRIVGKLLSRGKPKRLKIYKKLFYNIKARRAYRGRNSTPRPPFVFLLFFFPFPYLPLPSLIFFFQFFCRAGLWASIMFSFFKSVLSHPRLINISHRRNRRGARSFFFL